MIEIQSLNAQNSSHLSSTSSQGMIRRLAVYVLQIPGKASNLNYIEWLDIVAIIRSTIHIAATVSCDVTFQNRMRVEMARMFFVADRHVPND